MDGIEYFDEDLLYLRDGDRLYVSKGTLFFIEVNNLIQTEISVNMKLLGSLVKEGSDMWNWHEASSLGNMQQ